MSPEELEKEAKEGEVKKAPRGKKEVKEVEAAEPPTAQKEVKEEQVKEAPRPKKEAKALTKEEIITAIKSMTVLDLADLVKTLESEFGVSAAPVAVAATALTLKSFGEKKIEVIKAVREVTTLGLKQAKDLVEAAPQVVKEAVPKEEADTIKQKLEAAGATVEIK